MFVTDPFHLIKTSLMLGCTLSSRLEDKCTTAPLKGNLSSAQGPDQDLGWLHGWLDTRFSVVAIMA